MRPSPSIHPRAETVIGLASLEYHHQRQMAETDDNTSTPEDKAGYLS